MGTLRPLNQIMQPVQQQQQPAPPPQQQQPMYQQPVQQQQVPPSNTQQYALSDQSQLNGKGVSLVLPDRLADLGALSTLAGQFLHKGEAAQGVSKESLPPPTLKPLNHLQGGEHV